jgi:hypothetical protein
MGKCCLAKTRRSVEEEMLWWMLTLLRRSKQDLKILLNVLLSDVFFPALRAELLIKE